MKIRIRMLALPLADYNYPYIGICTGVMRCEGKDFDIIVPAVIEQWDEHTGNWELVETVN